MTDTQMPETPTDLLDAVKDEPLEDGPRLALADWLDKQGQQERAEFIRIQCRLAAMHSAEADWAQTLLAPLETDQPEGWGREWIDLWRREQELLARHGAAWAGPFADLGGQWRFRRGLLVLQEIEADRLLDRADEANGWGDAWEWVECVKLSPPVAALPLL